MTLSKKIYLLVIILLTGHFSNAQSWKKIILNDEVSVEFPSLPVKREVEGKDLYFYKATDYALMVGISKKAFTNYSLNLRLNENKRTKEKDDFLNGIINGKMTYGHQTLLSIKTIKIGECVGKKIAYLSADPKENASKRRFSILLLVKDTLYTFEYWYLKDQTQSDDRNVFFKSILVKEG